MRLGLQILNQFPAYLRLLSGTEKLRVQKLAAESSDRTKAHLRTSADDRIPREIPSYFLPRLVLSFGRVDGFLRRATGKASTTHNGGPGRQGRASRERSGKSKRGHRRRRLRHPEGVLEVLLGLGGR